METRDEMLQECKQVMRGILDELFEDPRCDLTDETKTKLLDALEEVVNKMKNDPPALNPYEKLDFSKIPRFNPDDSPESGLSEVITYHAMVAGNDDHLPKSTKDFLKRKYCGGIINGDENKPQ